LLAAPECLFNIPPHLGQFAWVSIVPFFRPCSTVFLDESISSLTSACEGKHPPSSSSSNVHTVLFLKANRLDFLFVGAFERSLLPESVLWPVPLEPRRGVLSFLGLATSKSKFLDGWFHLHRCRLDSFGRWSSNPQALSASGGHECSSCLVRPLSCLTVSNRI